MVCCVRYSKYILHLVYFCYTATLSINDDKPSGKDNLDGKLLKMVASDVAGPVCHIFNASISSGVFPMGWKEAKVIPLPKNANENFSGKNSRPISLLPILSKLLERIVTDQIQCFFYSE